MSETLPPTSPMSVDLLLGPGLILGPRPRQGNRGRAITSSNRPFFLTRWLGSGSLTIEGIVRQINAKPLSKHLAPDCILRLKCAALARFDEADVLKAKISLWLPCIYTGIASRCA